MFVACHAAGTVRTCSANLTGSLFFPDQNKHELLGAVQTNRTDLRIFSQWTVFGEMCFVSKYSSRSISVGNDHPNSTLIHKISLLPKAMFREHQAWCVCAVDVEGPRVLPTHRHRRERACNRPAMYRGVQQTSVDFQANAVQYRLIVRDVKTLQILQLYTCLDAIQHIEVTAAVTCFSLQPADSLWIRAECLHWRVTNVPERSARNEIPPLVLLQWSSDSEFLLCGMYKRGLVQVRKPRTSNKFSVKFGAQSFSARMFTRNRGNSVAKSAQVAS